MDYLKEYDKNEMNEARREAEYLAMVLWRTHYKVQLPKFVLCDSVAGIISQIDNMVAGLAEDIVVKNNRIARLETSFGLASKDIARYASRIADLEAQLSKFEQERDNPETE